MHFYTYLHAYAFESYYVFDVFRDEGLFTYRHLPHYQPRSEINASLVQTVNYVFKIDTEAGDQ